MRQISIECIKISLYIPNINIICMNITFLTIDIGAIEVVLLFLLNLLN